MGAVIFIILFISLIFSILFGFFGRFLGFRGLFLFTIIYYSIAFYCLYDAGYDIFFKKAQFSYEQPLWTFIIINEITIKFGILLDPINIIMCITVYIVSFLVHIYSFSYMRQDPHIIRFITFLSLFTFFMILILVSTNFVQLFFGWECVGLASYLLINFWYTRIQANKSALKAIIVNKIGDLAILSAIIAIFNLTKSFDFITVFNYLTYINPSDYEYTIFYNHLFNFKINSLVFINVCLLIGALAKSAQIGLHTWLADAMEGPTPVSALLHAATMVTVGVFCLIRCNSLFILTPSVLFYVVLFGTLTALFGGIVGLYQNDIKRIIAYSTCSQLGYMFCACGLTYNELALYHLVNHAFFKALLFLTAGAVIHVYKGWQDIRVMGASLNIYNELYIYFGLGSLALMGLPFFSGFFSKDLIIEFSFINIFFNNLNIFIYTLLILAAFFTSYYSFRIIYLTFIRQYFQSSKLIMKSLYVRLPDRKWTSILRDVEYTYKHIFYIPTWRSLQPYLKNFYPSDFTMIKPTFWGFLEEKSDINKNTKLPIATRHNIDLYTLFPLTILTLLTISSGWLLKDFFIGFGTDAFEGAFSIKHYLNFNNLYFSVEILPLYIKLLPNILSFIIIFILIFIIYKEYNIRQSGSFVITRSGNISHNNKAYKYVFNYSWFNSNNIKNLIYMKEILPNFKKFYNIEKIFNFENDFYFEKKLFFDVLYYKIFIKSTFFFAYNILYKLVDRGFFEILGPVGISTKIFTISDNTNFIHKSSFYHFIMYFIQNIIILIFIIFNIYNFYNLDILILLVIIIYTIKFINIKKR